MTPISWLRGRRSGRARVFTSIAGQLQLSFSFALHPFYSLHSRTLSSNTTSSKHVDLIHPVGGSSLALSFLESRLLTFCSYSNPQREGAGSRPVGIWVSWNR